MSTQTRSLDEARDRLEQIRREALAAVEAAATTAELEQVRVRYAGRKSELSQTRQVMGSLDEDGKKTFGAAFNATQSAITGVIQNREEDLRARELEHQLESERLDVTLPGTIYEHGYHHPVMRTMRELLSIFQQMGYAVSEGPEVEWDEYNFELLNFPRDHPARDLQDTFYVTDDMLLRTQTSPAQIRIMRSQPPPLRAVVPGMVYRDEAEDASHLSEFFQIEGLAVDADISLADLKGTLTAVCHRFFGEDRAVRFRPHYFPFTEPSAEIDIQCGICRGAGCRSCGGEGWLELGGAGMVHPRVLQAGGYDPEQVSGFAFGIGPDRFTMMRHDITDVRLLREADLRFLRQLD